MPLVDIVKPVKFKLMNFKVVGDLTYDVSESTYIIETVIRVEGLEWTFGNLKKAYEYVEGWMETQVCRNYSMYDCTGKA